MTLIDDQGSLAPAALAAVVARSPIVVTRPRQPVWPARRLPAGFDDVDAAILDWIAAEGRRAEHRFILM